MSEDNSLEVGTGHAQNPHHANQHQVHQDNVQWQLSPQNLQAIQDAATRKLNAKVPMFIEPDIWNPLCTKKCPTTSHCHGIKWVLYPITCDPIPNITCDPILNPQKWHHLRPYYSRHHLQPYSRSIFVDLRKNCKTLAKCYQSITISYL